MEHLEKISVEDLHEALDNVDGKKPTQRVIAAIAYKHGVSQTELAEWYGVERKTIYNWLKRLDAESLEHAVTDAHRSGRNRKLTDEQRKQFEQTLREPPTEAGYDAPTWTPRLAQAHLQDAYEVEYSIPSCRRLLKEAGLRYHPSLSRVVGTDIDDRDERHGESKLTEGGWLPR